MIGIPSEVADVMENASLWSAVAGLGPGIYGALAHVAAMFTRPPPPLTASKATLINRLRYPGGRKFRRAAKRLGLVVNKNLAALRTGPPCRYCGRATVPPEVGGPAVCETTFAFADDPIGGGRIVTCEPLPQLEDPSIPLGMPITEAPPSVSEGGGTSDVPRRGAARKREP